MDMLKHIYKGVFGVLLIGFAACTTEQLEDDLTPGTTPIQLRGAVTRAGGPNGNLNGYSNLYLSATTGSGGTTDFFNNIAITGITTNTTDNTKSDLKTGVYYPLNEDTEINLYGHTGAVTGGKMVLTSGTKTENDALISNGTTGEGTPGSAKTPVELLTFRHVMTKLEIAIDVTDADLQETKPTDIKIQFGTKVASKGKYALTTKAGDANDKSTDNSGTYELSTGTHYLVPTGANLTGQNIITSLQINNYTATPEDCAAITVPQADNGGVKSDLILSPGLSYKLTFVIKRLKVVGIKVTMNPWSIITSGDKEWGYEPQMVKMDVTGGYENEGDKLINKIVLHYTPGGGNSNIYQYIGSCEETEDDGVKAKFLTLPANLASGTMTADLYTENGLLIEGHTITYDNIDDAFKIALNANGMTKASDGYYEVATPLQFYNLMSAPGTDNAGDKYRLTKNIDISSLSLDIPTDNDFPTGGIFDGNGFSILHLYLKGNGLFKENRGTLKGIHLAFSTINTTSGDYVGSLCSINNGSIEGCINEADITATGTQVVGGICGQNNGTILACLNTGNIPAGKEIGGICGENANGTADAIKACISVGMLHESSNHGTDTENVGGICGLQTTTKSGNAVISYCHWLTGSARPVQGSSEEKAIGGFAGGETSTGDYCAETCNMTETLLRNEAPAKLNTVLTEWKFEWTNNGGGTYNTVWPIPVKHP